MSDAHIQNWDPNQYAEHVRFVSDLGRPVIKLLAPKPGERILDLGCGDGVLSVELIKSGCDVVGVDSSSAMVEAAKALGLKAHVMEAQALTFDAVFDAVFSNAALHWMKNPERVMACVWRALKPSGRFVGELGGYGNMATVVSALEAAIFARGLSVPNPWFFPRLEEYQKFLEGGGFTIESIDLFPRSTVLPGDVRGWLTMFAQPYTSMLPEGERTGFIAEVVEVLREKLVDGEGNWIVDYVRLRFSATKNEAESL